MRHPYPPMVLSYGERMRRYRRARHRRDVLCGVVGAVLIGLLWGLLP